MTAKKKAIIAIIIGGIIGVSVTCSTWNDWAFPGEALILIPLCMLYSFGFAFGWKRCKNFLTNAGIIASGQNFIVGFMIIMLSISVVWFPGVVWGIKEVLDEN